jgi:hypothetical protein
MNDFLSHLVAPWTVFALVILYFFKKPILLLLDRLTELKFPGGALSFRADTSTMQFKIEPKRLISIRRLQAVFNSI